MILENISSNTDPRVKNGCSPRARTHLLAAFGFALFFSQAVHADDIPVTLQLSDDLPVYLKCNQERDFSELTFRHSISSEPMPSLISDEEKRYGFDRLRGNFPPETPLLRRNDLYEYYSYNSWAEPTAETWQAGPEGTRQVLTGLISDCWVELHDEVGPFIHRSNINADNDNSAFTEYVQDVLYQQSCFGRFDDAETIGGHVIISPDKISDQRLHIRPRASTISGADGLNCEERAILAEVQSTVYFIITPPAEQSQFRAMSIQPVFALAGRNFIIPLDHIDPRR